MAAAASFDLDIAVPLGFNAKDAKSEGLPFFAVELAPYCLDALSVVTMAVEVEVVVVVAPACAAPPLPSSSDSRSFTSMLSAVVSDAV